MDAAKPVFFSTPQSPSEEMFDKIIDEKDKIMTDIKSFEMALTNEIFILELAKSENNKNIIIKLYKNKERFKNYIIYLNIDEFYSLNNFFRFYQNINELYILLLDIISKKKYSINIKNNLVLLILEFPMPGDKVIDINFELKQQKVKKEEQIGQLFETVTELTEENKIIKEEINNLKNENKQLKEQLNNLNKENIEIKDKLKLIEESLNKKKTKKVKKEEKEEIIEKEVKEEAPTNVINEHSQNSIIETPRPKKIINPENVFKESKIVKNVEDKKNLIEWLSSVGNISAIKLIYRATENGDDSNTFFDKCSNMGPTISLIKTKEDRIFGGFSKAEWTDKKGNVKLKDDTAFLFSLDNKEKYKILKPEIAISCYPDYYTLVYGNKDDRYGIRLFSNFLEKNNYENLASKSYDTPSDYCLSGHNKFEVEDAEVFQVIFE